MHKCNNLPHFVENGKECTARLEDTFINDTDCIDWHRYFTNCEAGETNPFDGAISFDNIGLAWVAIFLVSQRYFYLLGKDYEADLCLIIQNHISIIQVISLEGWTDVLYFVQDAHSFWNWLYFVLLIVVSF